jgi:probable HAF family extracellular repeat protein
MLALPSLVKGARSEAYGINESGVVVGWSQNAQGCRRGVVWPTTGNRAPQDLGGLGGCQSQARRIDAAGTIVGSAEYPGQGWVPVMALPGKKFDQIKWRGPVSEAMAISEVGRIVGFAGDSVGLGLGQIGSGSPTNLTPLPGSPGSAGFAVELCGSVVGASHAGFVTWPSFSVMNAPHATLWFNYGRDCA